jgi:hypothetical protein
MPSNQAILLSSDEPVPRAWPLARAKWAGHWLKLLLAAPGFLIAAEPAEPAPPPSYRYLIVLEASSQMDRQKDVALDTIHQLILTGVQSRIRPGEILGIWYYKDQLVTNRWPPVVWDPATGRDTANFHYRSLRDLGFSRQPNLSRVLAALAGLAGARDPLTVFLVCSGAQPFKGTPFDEPVNKIFTQHTEAMREARRPFVAVLVYEDGQLVAQAITPGGRSIYIPPSPKTRATPEKPVATTEPPAEATPAEPPATTLEPKPKPLSVDEISKRLREAEAQRRATNALATAQSPAPEPSVAPADGTSPAVAPTPTLADAPTAPPTAAIPAPAEESKPQPPEVPAPSAPPPVKADEPTEPRKEPVTQIVTAAPEATPPPAAPAPEPPPVVAEAPAAEGPAVAAPARGAPGVILPPAPAERRWPYLATAAVSLLAALALAWRFWRWTRHRPQPSVISRSLDRR